MKQLTERLWRPDRWNVAVGATVTMVTTVTVLTLVTVVTVVGCSTETTSPLTSSPSLPATSVGTSTTGTESSVVPPTTVTSTARIDEALTATDLATQLGEVERAAAKGDAGVGQRQQLLYRYLSAHVELDEAVLAALPQEARPYVERIVRARQFGQARQATNPNPSPPSGTLPPWTLVEPPPVDELLDDYRAAESATGINWYWLAAIHLQETRMGRIIGTSSAGAVGPMQFLPTTWASCCEGNPTIARDAIMGAAVYLAQAGGPADMPAALHVYNPSDTYVATVTAFAENMRDNPLLYAAYHDWQVFYSSSEGAVRLPIGYSHAQPVAASDYLAQHPDDAG